MLWDEFCCTACAINVSTSTRRRQEPWSAVNGGDKALDYRGTLGEREPGRRGFGVDALATEGVVKTGAYVAEYIIYSALT